MLMKTIVKDSSVSVVAKYVWFRLQPENIRVGNFFFFDLLLTVKKIRKYCKKMIFMSFESTFGFLLTVLHSERPKVYTFFAFLSATGFLSKKTIL